MEGLNYIQTVTFQIIFEVKLCSGPVYSCLVSTKSNFYDVCYQIRPRRDYLHCANKVGLRTNEVCFILC